MFKIGFSKDIHLLKQGEFIILGGIKIPCNLQVEAYSDGDALIHAIAESIFGALGYNDLGTYYNKKTKPKDFNSFEMLSDALEYLRKDNFKISNIDTLIQLDSPNLKEYKELIKQNLLEKLNLKENQISIKATTSENSLLNYIVCYSTVLIEKQEGK